MVVPIGFVYSIHDSTEVAKPRRLLLRLTS
jgi:hypothetical protein